jgi:signal transduction histidine kinase
VTSAGSAVGAQPPPHAAPDERPEEPSPPPADDAPQPWVALLTPTGRDAAVTQAVLGRTGFSAVAYDDMGALCAAIGGDEPVGAVLLAEEALNTADRARLLAMLDAQPSWSNVPIVVLTGEGELSRSIPPGLQLLAARANVTLLERPVRVATLVTTLRSALHARRRQFDLRDQLEERERKERELREAREQAESANRAKSEFLTMMSHELRTPLNAIGGYAQLLSLGVRGPVSPEQQLDLERIDRSQRHLLSLINDILNFAKIEAGHVSFDVRPVPLSSLLQSVEPLVMPQLRARDIHYSDAARDCDTTVLVDEEKARQILLNLLSNAIKFTPPSGTIAVTCEQGPADVRVTVTDSGIGIAAEKLDAIFEPFVQLERNFSSTHEGTGLGLSISRDLARRMGGELEVASTVGKGAAFTLTLPRDRDTPERG